MQRLVRHRRARARDLRPDGQLPYLREWRDRYVGPRRPGAAPGLDAEVARILAVANEAGIGIVPQGGNTGLVGGQIPSPDGTEIVLSVCAAERACARSTQTAR